MRRFFVGLFGLCLLACNPGSGTPPVLEGGPSLDLSKDLATAEELIRSIYDTTNTLFQEPLPDNEAENASFNKTLCQNGSVNLAISTGGPTATPGVTMNGSLSGNLSESDGLNVNYDVAGTYTGLAMTVFTTPQQTVSLNGSGSFGFKSADSGGAVYACSGAMPIEGANSTTTETYQATVTVSGAIGAVVTIDYVIQFTSKAGGGSTPPWATINSEGTAVITSGGSSKSCSMTEVSGTIQVDCSK